VKFLLVALIALVFNPFNSAEVGVEVARPEDGHKLYVTVFGNVPDTVITQVRGQYPDAHYRHFTEGDPFAERYRDTVGKFPAIVVQEPTGKVLYKKSGMEVKQYLPFPWDNEPRAVPEGCRPCRPEPSPQPVAPAVAPPVLVPDTVTPVPDTNDPNYVAALLLAGAGAGVGAGRKFYSELQGK
jgi:hypothetical protein